MIRLWIDDDSSSLRARITRSADVAGSGDVITTESDSQRICEMVRAWLEEFSPSSPKRGGS